MTGIATIVCVGLALLFALATGVKALLDRRPARADLLGAALVEVSVLFYLVLRVIDLAGGHHTDGLGLVIAYLIGLALTMPITVALGLAEPTRWGSVVLGVGGLVICVLLARINELWIPHG